VEPTRGGGKAKQEEERIESEHEITVKEEKYTATRLKTANKRAREGRSFW